MSESGTHNFQCSGTITQEWFVPLQLVYHITKLTGCLSTRLSACSDDPMTCCDMLACESGIFQDEVAGGSKSYSHAAWHGNLD